MWLQITKYLKFSLELYIAAFTVFGIAAYLVLHYILSYPHEISNNALILVLYSGGIPLVLKLFKKMLAKEFGSDILAGISIVVSAILEQYLAGALVVLMLSGGEALENFAIARASSVLQALARRMPDMAHKLAGDKLLDVKIEEILPGDKLVIFPHELCPADGTVIEGSTVMDESFLTGEPYKISKTIGSDVISGAINGEQSITFLASRKAEDSRYAKIMQVMQDAELKQPRMRRIGDKLGAIYTPLAVLVALLAYLISEDPHRFLAVLVVATPCPLLIAIPVAIIGSISLAAKRGIVIKNPAALEQLPLCTSILFDKTGTLTYGRPQVTDIKVAADFNINEVLVDVASLERYSKHPLAQAILDKASYEKLNLKQVRQVSEKPGYGLTGNVAERLIQVTSRNKLLKTSPDKAEILIKTFGEAQPGLECLVIIDNQPAAVFQFRDVPRDNSKQFIEHLASKHKINRCLLVSGDRQSEVEYLAKNVGITDVFFGQSPEDKVSLVRKENRNAVTVFVGDGINDAPALATASVGIALGQNSDITEAAADMVILDPNLEKLDTLFHISKRSRSIALQSAVGGMLFSIIGMIVAAMGGLSPVSGALLQEIIDLAAVGNALRASSCPDRIYDFKSS